MTARETWYVLEDDTVADPREVSADKAGILRHSNGLAVQMRGDVPRSRGVDPDRERAGRSAPKPPDAKPAAKDVAAEKPKGGYKTRETKAR
jgi:hypothetical protein